MAVFLQILIYGLAIGGIYAMTASGLTLIYSVTRQLHLTHGVFLTVALYLLWVCNSSFGWDPYMTVLLLIPLFFLLGLAVYLLFLKPFIKYPAVLSFQIFLGLIWIMESILLLSFETTPRISQSAISSVVINLPGNLLLGLPQIIALVVAILSTGIFYVVLKTTDFGRAVRAVAFNSGVASIMGINVNLVQSMVCGIGFILIALAAALISPWMSVTPMGGLEFVLFSLIVMVFGGMGNFVGALVAGVILGVARSLGMLVLGSALAAAVPYALLVVILVFRPQGLFKPM